MQRAAGTLAPGRNRRHSCGFFRRGLRHSREQHLWFHPHCAGRVRPGRPDARAESGSLQGGARGGQPVLYALAPALRGGLDWADHQAAVAGPHHLGRHAGGVYGAGRGADRRRSGRAAGGDLPGHSAGQVRRGRLLRRDADGRAAASGAGAGNAGGDRHHAARAPRSARR